MPRMQVYLPEALYREVKERGLPASELLQEAIVAEVRRRQLNDNIDEYLRDLVAEVGPPTEAERRRAEAFAQRIEEHLLAARRDDARS